MAARGRGRGGPGRSMSINVEALGFGRGGDVMPAAMTQPPSLYPPLERQPLPLQDNDMYSYLIDLKHDFQTFMEDSPFYLKHIDSKTDIARYSDKYKTLSSSSANEENMLLLDLLPEELQPKSLRKASGKHKAKRADKSKQEVLATLNKTEGDGEDQAAADDEDAAATGAKNSDDSDAQNDSDVELDDEGEDDAEDDNDYVHEYFDNGENFIDADDDGLDDGPVY